MNRPATPNVITLAFALPALGAGIADEVTNNTRGAIDRGGWLAGILVFWIVVRRLRAG